jgi:hypothetical protein
VNKRIASGRTWAPSSSGIVQIRISPLPSAVVSKVSRFAQFGKRTSCIEVDDGKLNVPAAVRVAHGSS